MSSNEKVTTGLNISEFKKKKKLEKKFLDGCSFGGAGDAHLLFNFFFSQKFNLFFKCPIVDIFYILWLLKSLCIKWGKAILYIFHMKYDFKECGLAEG